MKKGFTLIEMLIVVVVLVTLMSITFKLSSIGEDQSRLNTTVNRMQRLENCLSGYYAAFGTYPPVKLHGSRDYNLKVNKHGIQTGDENDIKLDWYVDSGAHGIGTENEKKDWKQVQAACRSQPVAMRFPYESGYNDFLLAEAEVKKETKDPSLSKDTQDVVNAGYDDGYTSNPGRHNLAETDWTESQLFQFGVMSFLLPRYSIMMNGDEKFFRQGAQWIANNTIPCDPLGNGEKFGSWWDLREWVGRARSGNDKEAQARVKYIPTQAVCARWLPNLEGNCHCGSDAGLKQLCYGVDISAGKYLGMEECPTIFSPGGADSNSTSSQYELNCVTLGDGWCHEFYYYSPAPYQSYTVWSAGKNGRTFPPWASRDGFSSKQNQAIGAWVDDDIIHMSH